MRTIKFRAYINGEMVSDYLILSGGQLFENGRKFEDYIPTEAPLMQFTGLIDNDGKEIYEDDIVIDPEFPQTTILVIGFEQGAFVASKPNGDFEFHAGELDNNCVKIGNRWENPELLNETD